MNAKERKYIDMELTKNIDIDIKALKIKKKMIGLDEEIEKNEILKINQKIKLLEIKKKKLKVFKKNLTFSEQVIYNLLNSSDEFLTNEDLSYESKFSVRTVERCKKRIRQKYKDFVLI